MKLVKIFIICLVSTLLASCAGISRTPYKNDPVETKVVLQESNYKIVKEVQGEWSATYVFGIGGLKKQVLETNAISEMYKNAQLTGNQQIINITTTQTVETWAIGIYAKHRVIARGYVIEFE
jgi:hypothetical protein